jgi:glycosyltransferase involved in cell wall biosynthesis
VSVIVPVFDDEPGLRRLLAALDEQDASFRFECLVIDNGSSEPLGELQTHAFVLRTLREDRPGSYAARNLGISAARGRILAFTDADCIPDRKWLRSAVERIEQGAALAVVGGCIEAVLDDRSRSSAFAWHSLAADFDQARFVSVYRFAATANLVAEKAVFDQVGRFDDTLYSGGDFEWGRRAAAQGVPLIYVAAAIVRHPARDSWSGLVKRTRRIAGGHYAMHHELRFGAAQSVLLGARAGMGSLRRIWKDPRLPGWVCRLQASLLEFALRTLHMAELLRLGLGGSPSRR